MLPIKDFNFGSHTFFPNVSITLDFFVQQTWKKIIIIIFIIGIIFCFRDSLLSSTDVPDWNNWIEINLVFIRVDVKIG